MKRCVGGSGSGDSGRLEYGSVPRRNVTSLDGEGGWKWISVVVVEVVDAASGNNEYSTVPVRRRRRGRREGCEIEKKPNGNREGEKTRVINSEGSHPPEEGYL